MKHFAIIVASNSDQVLQSSLLASPDLKEGFEISVQRGFRSAAAAYNDGIASTTSDVMIFVHQDVYLPAGWRQRLDRALEWLDANDPRWGVLGLFGVEKNGAGQGHVYSTGLRRVIGEFFEGARRVETLDEVMLILRRNSGLRFDESLHGFHLYGGDICLMAETRGLKNYAISACAVHNTNGIRFLPRAYWKIFFQMRTKWRARLPVQTPCMPITSGCGAALRYAVRRPLWLLRHGASIGARVTDPKAVWEHVVGSG